VHSFEKTVCLSSLFGVPTTVNSVIFNNGNCFSTFSLEHYKETATRLLKIKKKTGAPLDEVYNSAQERTAARQTAVAAAAKRAHTATRIAYLCPGTTAA